MAEADIVVKERYVADMSHAVPIEPHADRRPVAGRPGHDLVVDAGAVHRPKRRRDHARAARGERPHHRAAPRRRLRRQVRVPLRGAGGGAGARRPAAGAAGVLAPRGVPRPRSPPRGTGARARDRRAQGRQHRRPPRPPDPGQRRLQRRRAVLPAARRDDGGRPLQDRERVRRRQPGLHEHAALRLGARAHGAAGLLGARAAHGLGGRADGHGSRSSSAAATSSSTATRAPPGRCSRTSAPRRRWSGRSR